MRRAVPAQRAAHATQSRRPYPATLMYITIILPMLRRAAPAHGPPCYLRRPPRGHVAVAECRWVRWQMGSLAHACRRMHAAAMRAAAVREAGPPVVTQPVAEPGQGPVPYSTLTAPPRPRLFTAFAPYALSRTCQNSTGAASQSEVFTGQDCYRLPLSSTTLLMRSTEQLRTVPNPSLPDRISHHTIPHSLQCFMPCIRLYTLHRIHAARNRIHSTRPSVLLYWKPTPTPPREPPAAHHLLPSPAPRPVREPHRPRSPPAAPRSAASDRSPMRLPSGPRHACRPRR